MRLIFIDGSDWYIDIIAKDIDIKPTDTVEEIEKKAEAIKDALKKDYGMKFILGVIAREPKKHYRNICQVNRAVRRYRRHHGPYNGTGEDTNFAYVVINGDNVSVTLNKYDYAKEERKYNGFRLQFCYDLKEFLKRNIPKNNLLSTLLRFFCRDRRLSRKLGLHMYHVDVWNWSFYVRETGKFICMEEIEDQL